MTGLSIIEYQYKMCLYGKPTWIMPYEIVVLPEGYEYSHDEGVYKPLWDSRTSQMTEAGLKAFLSAFSGLILSLHDHLLDLQNIEPDESSVMTHGDGEIVFLYQPFQREEPLTNRQVIEYWLMLLHRHVDTASEYAMGVLHPVNIAAASENIDLPVFAKLIKKTIGECQ